MPLIIITGYPASGKTTRSLALVAALQDIISGSPNPAHRNLTVRVVNDESVHNERSAYGAAPEEKMARATFGSAVRRELTAECIVIADGMNYIKGFRYQLHCEAKALGTPSCCLHVATPPEHSQVLNAAIDAAAPGSAYAPDVLENLIFRYEEPSAFARWDSPLFTLPLDSDPPAEDIFRAIVGGLSRPKGAAGADKDGDTDKGATNEGLRRVKPNLATVAPLQSDADALQRVDGLCAEVVRKVIDFQRERGTEAEGRVGFGEVQALDEKDIEPVVVKVPSGGFTTAGIQRLRREFVGLIRSNPEMARRMDEMLRAEFVAFINRRTWEEY